MTGRITRVPQTQIDADIETYRALGGLADYVPRNPGYSRESVGNAFLRMDQAETAIVLAESALAAARSEGLAARADFHNVILGVKDEAMVIFGPDSDEIAALGLKKKSERNKPKRAAKPATDK